MTPRAAPVTGHNERRTYSAAEAEWNRASQKCASAYYKKYAGVFYFCGKGMPACFFEFAVRRLREEELGSSNSRNLPCAARAGNS